MDGTRSGIASQPISAVWELKVAQELLRHANSRITMDLYTRAVSADKRSASERQVEMLLGQTEGVTDSSLVIPRDESRQLSGVINL